MIAHGDKWYADNPPVEAPSPPPVAPRAPGAQVCTSTEQASTPRVLSSVSMSMSCRVRRLSMLVFPTRPASERASTPRRVSHAVCTAWPGACVSYVCIGSAAYTHTPLSLYGPPYVYPVQEYRKGRVSTDTNHRGYVSATPQGGREGRVPPCMHSSSRSRTHACTVVTHACTVKLMHTQ
jgi:hypothetical protein